MPDISYITWNESAKRAQHGPSRMQQLQLEVALEVGLLRRQARRVEAIVARRLPYQVLRIAEGQRAQPFGPLRAVPPAAGQRVKASLNV